MNELKLYLGDVTLIVDVPKPLNKNIPRIPRCLIISVSSNLLLEIELKIEIDERYYNSFRVMGRVDRLHGVNSSTSTLLKSKFDQFKKSNTNYGNWDFVENIGENRICYEGSIPLYVEDFFEYLKMDNRDKLISNILE